MVWFDLLNRPLSDPNPLPPRDHEIFDLVSALEAAEGKGTDFYTFVGVDPAASVEVINKAYRRRSLALHPDKNPGVKDIQARFARLGVITNILRDPVKRERYNVSSPLAARPLATGRMLTRYMCCRVVLLQEWRSRLARNGLLLLAFPAVTHPRPRLSRPRVDWRALVDPAHEPRTGPTSHRLLCTGREGFRVGCVDGDGHGHAQQYESRRSSKRQQWCRERPSC